VYWEYVLDEALFTAPAHPQWGGAALLGEDGRLLGIGSLLVQEAVGGKGGRRQHVRANRPARAHPRGHARYGPASRRRAMAGL
jgi:hypothetical protein